ncbi:MAG TPA: histidine kinase [Bacteroidia bacterium]|jgi:LytS/YehU family sensor histidine kinase|nr:histidine kinase [Bacteroidia bacterium]
MISKKEPDYKKQSKENEQIRQLELELRSAQMNHHFIFNVLASIEYFLVKNNSETARAYLNKFSQLIRKTLYNSRRKYITLEEDLCTLIHYIELEFLRLGNMHQLEIDVDEKINASDFLIQPLLIQPFVENAIKHGLQNKKSSSHLQIKISFVKNELCCIVKDDGAGRDKKLIHMNHNCSGISITQERLKYLHERFHTRYAFQINDLEKEGGTPTGTSVQFNIPYILKEDADSSDRGMY